MRQKSLVHQTGGEISPRQNLYKIIISAVEMQCTSAVSVVNVSRERSSQRMALHLLVDGLRCDARSPPAWINLLDEALVAVMKEVKSTCTTALE